MRMKIDQAAIMKNGDMISVTMGKKNILIAKVDDAYYAVSDKCSHLGCALSKGTLEKQLVTCPCHGSVFDVTDGKPVEWIKSWPKAIANITRKLGFAKKIRVYRMHVDGNDVYMELPE